MPKSVIKRLALYCRILHRIEMDGLTRISSKILAQFLGITPAQVRKDLAYFGQFGVPGFGYNPHDLRIHLKKILGTDRIINLAIIGVGNLGKALLSYVGFKTQGFKFIAAFDLDQRKVGRKINELKVSSINELEKILKDSDVDIVVLTVPANAAQEVVDRLVKCNITAILNFAPIRIDVPSHVRIHSVDLAMELERLSFYLR
ncbi:redox-sensing transcriptional repressor Rex [Candidatus Sumerlaeota bacterium]|nr:redox-sensing transcriptional repressor Rex [Candidatus Sumerlaeota bacterium]